MTLLTPSVRAPPSHLYGKDWPKVFFEPLVGALSAITVDDMGREALKAKLSKIVIANTTSSYGASAFTFEGGTLTIDHEPHTNVDDVTLRTEALRELLERSL